MHILDEIVEKKRLQLEEEKREIPYEEIVELSRGKKIRDFTSAIREAKGLAIISEIKKASPSKGIIREDFDPVEIAKLYEKEGYNAFSVLTEKNYFLGENSYIERVKEVSTRPILRKDFIFDRYQIYQTKAIGGDAILLIASVLKDKTKDFYREAKEIGLHPLVEVHSIDDIKYIENFEIDIIGINNRDLRNFKTDIRHTETIMEYLPKDSLVISESGIKSKEDLEYLKRIGADGVLVGETLMRNLADLGEII